MHNHFTTLWDSLEFIAKLKQCSCSRLAVRGGLNSTTFNRSKRTSNYNQEHWISVNSLIKVLNGANMSMLEFGVIYHIIYKTRTSPKQEHVQKAISDINTLMQQHIDGITQAS
ncbi:hypothetical protein HDR61_03055 [bacterium]|nr:hypothetical protein [bacterium]